MRIILDTNVLISGIFFGGPPGRILQAWRDRRVRIIVSAPIMKEYRRVAEEIDRKAPGTDIDRILELNYHRIRNDCRPVTSIAGVR